LALLDFALPKQKTGRKKNIRKKIKKKKKISYYPKIDVQSIVAYLVWALSGSVWLLQSVTHRKKILPNIGLTTAPIGPLNC
jgi:D-mannonate dehydratase